MESSYSFPATSLFIFKYMVLRNMSAYLSIQLLICPSVFLFTKIKVHIVKFTLSQSGWSKWASAASTVITFTSHPRQYKVSPPPCCIIVKADCYTALDLCFNFTFSSRGVSLSETWSDKHFLWNNRSIRLHPVQRGVIFLEKVQGQHFLQAKAEMKSAKQFEGADSLKLDYIFQFKIWSVLHSKLFFLFSHETVFLLMDLQRFLSSQETVNESNNIVSLVELEAGC